MNTSTISVLLAGVATVMSLVALVRTRKISAINLMMQRWNWRQKFLHNVSQCTAQLTKADILLTQLSYRLNALDSTVLQLKTAFKTEAPVLEELVASIRDAKAVFTGQKELVGQFGIELQRAWVLPEPDAALDAEINRLASKIENLALRMTELSARLDEISSELAAFHKARVAAF